MRLWKARLMTFLTLMAVIVATFPGTALADDECDDLNRDDREECREFVEEFNDEELVFDLEIDDCELVSSGDDDFDGSEDEDEFDGVDDDSDGFDGEDGLFLVCDVEVDEF